MSGFIGIGSTLFTWVEGGGLKGCINELNCSFVGLEHPPYQQLRTKSHHIHHLHNPLSDRVHAGGRSSARPWMLPRMGPDVVIHMVGMIAGRVWFPEQRRWRLLEIWRGNRHCCCFMKNEDSCGRSRIANRNGF